MKRLIAVSVPVKNLEVETEDNGCSMYVDVDVDDNLSFSISSWDENKKHTELKNLLKKNRLEITIKGKL